MLKNEMVKKFIAGSVMVILFALLFVACGNPGKGTVSTGGFVLYYLNAEATELEAVSYALQSSDTEGMIEEVIARQKDEPAEAGKLRLLPDGVEIIGHKTEGTTLTLDFSAGFSDSAPERALLVRGGIVREFLQIAGVERVIFTVAGEELTDSYGNAIGPMTTDSFVENSAKTINSYQSATMTLYFTDVTGTKLVIEPRKVYYIGSESLERAVLGELMKGPKLTGHYATFGTDNHVLSVITQDDVCYVNFDTESLSSVLSVSEEVQIYSIVNSLADTCGIEKVQFSVDGDSTGVFRESMSLSEQYTKKETLID